MFGLTNEKSQVIDNKKEEQIDNTAACNDVSNEMSNDIFNLNQFFNEQIENFVIVENSFEDQQSRNQKDKIVTKGFTASAGGFETF